MHTLVHSFTYSLRLPSLILFSRMLIRSNQTQLRSLVQPYRTGTLSWSFNPFIARPFVQWAVCHTPPGVDHPFATTLPHCHSHEDRMCCSSEKLLGEFECKINMQCLHDKPLTETIGYVRSAYSPLYRHTHSRFPNKTTAPTFHHRHGCTRTCAASTPQYPTHNHQPLSHRPRRCHLATEGYATKDITPQ